jgi:hypothetical protein
LFVSFIPPSDAEFDNWFCNFATAFAEKWQGWGFTESDWQSVESAWVVWHKAFATRSLEASSARSFAENTIVGVINQLVSTSSVNDSDWSLLGLNGKPEVSSSTSSTPALHLDRNENGEVVVNWNVVTHPVWNWVEIQCRNDDSDWEEVAKVATSSTPFNHSFDGDSPVQYRARWVSSSDATGPWSAIGNTTLKAA